MRRLSLRCALPSAGRGRITACVDDARYQRIEERVAWLERHVLEQDRAMLELSRSNDLLRKQLKELGGRLGTQGQSGLAGDEVFDGNEKPPHY